MSRIIERIRPAEFSSRFAGGAIGSFGLKVASTGMMFAVSIFLTREMGANGFGTYAYAITWINLIVVFATFGFDQLLIREVAVFNAQRDWRRMVGILRWTNGVVLLITLVVGAGVFASTYILRIESAYADSLRLAVWLLPIIALTRLRQSTLRGLLHIVPSQLPELLIQPLLLLLTIAGSLIVLDKQLVANDAIRLQIAAAMAAFLVGAVFLRHYLPDAVRHARPEFNARGWLASGLPLVLFGAMRELDSKIDTVMLGIIQDPASVGIYTAAIRGAELIAFVLVAVNAVLAPTVAELYASGDLHRLQRLLTQSARVVFVLSLPIGLGLVVFGEWFLSFFGPEFVAGYPALVIVVLARVFNASVGSVALILIMTGFERDVALGVGLGALLNTALNVILIPKWGIVGAAIATASGTLFWDLFLTVAVFHRTGAHTTIFGRLAIVELINHLLPTKHRDAAVK